jgi:hypothetical protein
MTYKFETVETPTGEILIKKIDENKTIWFIPSDPDNSDYQEYLKSLENAE